MFFYGIIYEHIRSHNTTVRGGNASPGMCFYMVNFISNNMLEYYSILNIPTIPKNIVDTTVSHADMSSKPFNNLFGLTLKDNSVEHSALYHRTVLDQACVDWITENIPELANKSCTFGYQYIDAVPGTSGLFGAHTDGTRRGVYVLSYILDTGSDSTVTTHWWKEIGQDKYRAPSSRAPDYRKLDELSSVVIPANTWHMLDASILHSISGIKTRRIAITVGVNNKELADLIWANYKF